MIKNNEEIVQRCFNCRNRCPISLVKKAICGHWLCGNCIGIILFNNSFQSIHKDFSCVHYACVCAKGDNIIDQAELISMLKGLSGYHSSESKSNDTKCSQHNLIAEVYCKECSCLLCSTCLKAHHTHKLLTVNDFNEKSAQFTSQLPHKSIEEQKASLTSLQLLFESTYTRESSKVIEKIDLIIDSFTKVKKRITEEYAFRKGNMTIIGLIISHFYNCLGRIERFSFVKQMQLEFSGVLIDFNANMDIISKIAQLTQEKSDSLINESILRYRFIMKPFELRYSSHKNYFIKKSFKYNQVEGIPKKVIQLWNLSIAVGFSTEMIHIYDHLKYTLIKSMKGKENNSVTSLIEMDNGQLLSGSLDTTIKLWDIHHSKYVEAFEAHLTSTAALIQLRNGFVVSGSCDGELKL